MSTDPYYVVQQEVQSSLQSASQLQSSYKRIRQMTTNEESEELVWARNELKATLASLEADLEVMEESIQTVEASGARMFGLEEQELQNRKRYVERVRKEVENMRAEVSPNSSQAAGSGSRPDSGGRVQTPRPEDDQSEWSRQEQQMMMAEQDRTIDSISGTLTSLARQAGLMGQEISEHNELLDGLEAGVDRTENKLGTAMTKMKRFVRQTEETKSGWCIVILIIVLMLLLLAVILV
ncbi:t-SNARE [Pterulicium gracile]|uniref:t-SNARE n=1 Tax=Pterulicium gracile TaxID=1884261 RepID=A0A5C3QPS6_9AGAR|nr:t-SNARE [Pterula gracilis]